jgi:hypothetical protein
VVSGKVRHPHAVKVELLWLIDQDTTMGAAGRFRVLDFPALDADAEPARVRSVENDDVSGLLLPLKASDQQPPELVPDLSAGTADEAIPVAGSAPRPAARYRGGSILPPEPRGSRFVAGGYEVPIEDTALLMDALAWRRRSNCPGAARASRGKSPRHRGSRRGATATRAGPEPDDPELAGFGAPVGDRSRVLRTLVGGSA